MDAAVESLRSCPVCCCPHRFPILQCSNGHFLCEQCLRALREVQCPTCRVCMISPSRNLLADAIAQASGVSLRCRWKQCGFASSDAQERVRHEASDCPHRPVFCAVCTEEQQQPAAAATHSQDELMQHLIGAHGVQLVESDDAGLHWLPLNLHALPLTMRWILRARAPSAAPDVLVTARRVGGEALAIVIEGFARRDGGEAHRSYERHCQPAALRARELDCWAVELVLRTELATVARLSRLAHLGDFSSLVAPLLHWPSGAEHATGSESRAPAATEWTALPVPLIDMAIFQKESPPCGGASVPPAAPAIVSFEVRVVYRPDVVAPAAVARNVRICG